MAESIPAIVQILLGKLGEELMNQIKNQLSFLCCYHFHVERLNEEVQKLEVTSSTVEQQVEAAGRNLELIRPDVADWLKRANDTQIRSRRILDKADNIRKRCLLKWLPMLHYSLSLEAKKATDASVQLQNTGKFERVSNPPNPADLQPIPATSEIGLRSRDLVEKEIMDALEDDRVYLIGLCGMGGVGKTTMATKIKNWAKTKTSMFEVVVFAVVSQRLDPKEVQQQIAEGIGLKLEERSLEIRAEKLHARLKNAKGFLIILDDVWKKLDLEKLGIPSKGSPERRKLILTSRDRDALNLTNDSKILTINILPDEEAWNLFREKAGSSIDAPDLLETAKGVAKQCKGLPLALTVVGSALRNKSMPCWEDALRQLKRSSTPPNLPGVLEELYVPLKWSYDQLPSEEARYIFRLCCLFPEDYEISTETLVGYGWGLGLFSGIENLREAADRVSSLVEILKSRFLLIHARNGDRIYDYGAYVKMHDVIRDMAISTASDDGYVFMVSDDRKNWPRKVSYENYTHISVELIDNCVLPESITCSRLDFLSMELGEKFNAEVPENFFASMEGLKVLSASGFRSLPSSICLLTNLGALYLHKCEQLKIASFAGKMENLEILSLRNSRIQEFPRVIGLKNLKRLDLTHCSITEIESGAISGLVQLQELLMMLSHGGKYWKPERRAAIFAEIACLSNLVTLQTEIWLPSPIFLNSPNCPKLEAYHIEKRTKHQVSWYEFRRSIALPCKKFVSLGYSDDVSPIGNFFLPMIRNAQCLEVEGDCCIRIVNELAVEGFNKVKALWLAHFNNVEYLVHAADGVFFAALESLYISSSRSLKEICSCPPSIGSFGSLKQLHLRNLHRLKHALRVSKFEIWSQLQRLNIERCEVMEHVFWEEEEAENQITTNNNIKFLNLRELHLRELPTLEAFCKGISGELELPALETLEISDLPKITNFCPTKCNLYQQFLISKQVLCPNLKSLELRNIDSTGIFSCEIPKRNFNGLEILIVRSCQNLRHVLAPPMWRGLTNLKKLELRNCEKLQEVIVLGEDREEPKEILFPQLEELELWELPNMHSFCHKTTDLQFSSLKNMKIELDSLDSTGQFLFNKEVLCTNLKSLTLREVKSIGIFKSGIPKNNFSGLEVLNVQSCQNLRNVLAPPMFRGLTNLKKLQLRNCEKLQEVIVLEEDREEQKEILFPQLEELYLGKLPEMHSFCHMTTDLQFPSLKNMSIRDCPLLDSLDSNGQFLFNKAAFCTNLKSIILYKVNSTGIFRRGIPKRNFSGLEVLNVQSCQNVRHVFAPPMFRGLTNLKTLELKDCEKLQEVILPEEDREGQKETLFSQLEELKLSKLPNMHSFCYMATDFQFPSLKSMIIEYCPLLDSLDSTGQFLFNKGVFSQNLKSLMLYEVNSSGIFSRGTPKRNFSGLEVLNVQSCQNVRHVFAPPMFRGLTNLKTLELKDCEKLQEVILPEEDQEGQKETLFSQLEELKLSKLPNMHSFCNMTTDFQFPSLKSMIIEYCPLLNSLDSTGEFLFNKGVFSPNLKSLMLYEVNSSGIFSRGTPKRNFSGLEVLIVQSCRNLRNVLAPPMFKGLTNLKRLYLVDCEELQEVIVPEEDQEKQKETVFPRLEELKLQQLPKMHRFCNMTTNLQLPSLKNMTIENCWSLESFYLMGTLDYSTSYFSFNKEIVCTNLKRLELYKVNSVGVFNCGIPEGSFSGLEILEVKSCHNLRNILAPLLSRGLIKLKKLNLADCKELQEVIISEEDRGPTNSKETLFPNLKELKLSKLPKLLRFCHMTNDIELPSPLAVTIEECPILKTFSSGSLHCPSIKVYGMQDPILATKIFFNKEKSSEEIQTDSNCFRLSVKDLSNIWDDKKNWDTYLMPDSSESFAHVAEPRYTPRMLRVEDSFSMPNLSPGYVYEIFYMLMLVKKTYSGRESVEFELTLPNGEQHRRIEILNDKPRGEWLEIQAGEFRVEPNQMGELKISLYMWRAWPLLNAVIIRPKSK